jgi:hypothetical protein
MKKNFLLLYQAIYEMSFLIIFLITFFVTEDYKWLAFWPLIDNLYNYILIWIAHEDQKKWFAAHAAQINPNSPSGPKKKPFGIYILLEILRTTIISLCMHSVLIDDDIPHIWIGVVV